ncbi:unnamed protein product [Caenorhabditis bovis]|uniref:RING-CH-type domain-containing protein n=1 Tax=Caenorhabditis bovis TaxID=2654633 RepID=A0A8S1EX04_9PELO|nr:unnamed protein product [Caenorhabditis bovis]
MGERIRLFSTTSYVAPVVDSADASSSHQPPTNAMAKSHSLNSVEENGAPIFVSARCPSSRRSNKEKRIVVGSQLSLPGVEDALIDDADVSQLGILCNRCSTSDLACSKMQKELPSPTASSVYSLARSDLSSEPLCRICHCCWPPDSNDPLISPCRCSGSLQYVHVSCLMHWLDISSRKLHRPAICELCLYKYRRRRVLKYREMKLPACAQTDIRYYTLFVAAILMMMLSAFATIVCFQLEKSYGHQERAAGASTTTPTTTSTSTIATTIAGSSTNDESLMVGVRKRISKSMNNPMGVELMLVEGGGENRREDTENILSTVTLIAAMVFFLSFFLAMYAHVKSGLSFCGYLTLCWSSNLEWSIEEYKHSRDTQYLNKLEELRRKINEKQKKAPDEVEPLRSSVIVLE